MATISISCPKCQVQGKADESYAGKSATCKRCGTKFVVGSASSAVSPSPPSRSAEDDSPQVWQPGQVILNLYEVTDLLGEGGMGQVHKVRHRGWNMDLAVKSPRAAWIARAGGVENFVSECETWVNLGLHPHIVSCYYVRTLAQLPQLAVEKPDFMGFWVKSLHYISRTSSCLGR